MTIANVLKVESVAVTVLCDRCKKEYLLKFTNMSIRAGLIEHGWKYDWERSADYCPDCQGKKGAS